MPQVSAIQSWNSQSRTEACSGGSSEILKICLEVNNAGLKHPLYEKSF